MSKAPLILTPIQEPKLMAITANIPSQGMLHQTETGYVYLKVDDRFIHRIFPLLKTTQKKLPPYFAEPYNIGAHISVIYKEEIKKLQPIAEIGSTFHFNILELCEIKINEKVFFALTIQADGFITLRKKYGFSEKPVYHGIPVDYHITIAMGGV
jgi:hypothetical protein